MENRKCLKCQSKNLPDAAYCRFCHEKFNQAITFVEKKGRRKLTRKLIVAGSGGLLAAAGYIFKKKTFGRKKKQVS